MKITWLGHASFLVESKDGTRVVTDPFEAGSYDGAVGYAPINTRADVVTVSHEHADHNAVDAVTGAPEIVRDPGARTVKGISIRGIATFHDESKGQDRGRNNIYVMDVDGVKVGHLGDLGHALSPAENGGRSERWTCCSRPSAATTRSAPRKRRRPRRRLERASSSRCTTRRTRWASRSSRSTTSSS